MATTEATTILDAAQKLFGLTNDELENRLADPKQMLILADISAVA